MTINQVQWYHEIGVRVAAGDVELIADYIIEHIAGGLLLEDEEGEEYTVIKFYISPDQDVEASLAGLEQFIDSLHPNGNPPEFSRKKIRDFDWIESYRKSVIPIHVGDDIVVKPPWSEESFPGKTVILLEPGMAFGTGRHETSRSCLAELEKLDLHNAVILDVGCGSGILGIYAALRGAAQVHGCDIDSLAVENASKNFALNKVDHICRVSLGSVADIPAGLTYDVVIANIIKSVIVSITGALNRALKPGGTLILSGLLEQDRDDIEAALHDHGLDDFTIRHDTEWFTYAIRKP